MTELFLRSGTPWTGTVHGDDRPYAVQKKTCRRCGGAGGSDAWVYTGWRCYDCGGTGTKGTERLPLYSAARLARLDATLATRRAKQAAAEAAKAAEAKAAAQRLYASFEAAYGPEIAFLRAKAEGDGFLASMLTKAQTYGELTEKQIAAVRNSMARAAAQAVHVATSAHVGTIGERIEAVVVVERETSFVRESFYSRSGGAEEVFVTTLRDEAGNALVVMSPSFREPIGSRLRIKGTVTRHGEFRGEAQTTLNRVKATAIAEGRAA
jgi:hypothetical protein